MGGLVITDVNNLYDKLLCGHNETREYLEEGKDPGPILFKDTITIPEGRAFEIGMVLRNTTYSAVMSVYSGNVLDFENFQPRVTREIKKQTKFDIYKMGPNCLFIRHPGDNFFSYGVDLKNINKEPSLNVFLGVNGLTVKNIANKKDFKKAIEDLETIANITFHPFLKGKNVPSNILYYLDP